jgi:hypothetical protein
MTKPQIEQANNQFIPKENTTYYCTSDIGLTAYLIYKDHKLSCIQDNNEKLIFVLESNMCTYDDIDVYEGNREQQEIIDYMKAINTIHARTN